ncbi:MAG: hypothetical protein RL322_1196 [Pseudomonadota bacterium]|jgi:predicted metal-dependent phosphoesterase TrpH
MSDRPVRLSVNADLHCHSNFSDGVLSPEQLVERAAAHGVELFALTDHDEIGGQSAAASAARACGLAYVGGVEISVSWGGETVHVVGLRIDWEDEALREGLARTRSGRDQRAREMAAALEAAGIPDAYQGALRHVGNPALISRTHFARHIVEAGVCSDLNEVFRKYLVEGKPGYVEHRWAKLEEAIDWIRGAGGVAILAHPGRYRFNDTQLWALIDRFRQLGGEALEVVCGSHSREQYGRFARIVREAGLKASRGSDFHAPGERHIELGRLPPLPDTLEPVWADWDV